MLAADDGLCIRLMGKLWVINWSHNAVLIGSFEVLIRVMISLLPIRVVLGLVVMMGMMVKAVVILVVMVVSRGC